jgi:hypothetical protein
MELRYLYVGTSDTERDLVAWLAWPDARLETPEGPSAVLRDASGTEVAALQVDRPDVFGA